MGLLELVVHTRAVLEVAALGAGADEGIDQFGRRDGGDMLQVDHGGGVTAVAAAVVAEVVAPASSVDLAAVAVSGSQADNVEGDEECGP